LLLAWPEKKSIQSVSLLARASELAVSAQATKIFQAPPGGPAQSIF